MQITVNYGTVLFDNICPTGVVWFYVSLWLIFKLIPTFIDEFGTNCSTTCLFPNRCFVGVPRSELAGGLRSSSKLPLKWTPEDLRRHILSLFPRVRNFTYMKCNQGKTLDPLPDDTKPADLRNLLGRSGLYVVPTGPLLPKVCRVHFIVIRS